MRTRSIHTFSWRPASSLVLLPLLGALTGCPEPKAPPAPPATGTTAATATRPPEELFAELRCRNCHGPGAMFSAALDSARGKPDETVAMWILDAQKVKPGTAMPSFVELLSTQEALSLARWIKAGNPVAPPAQ